MINAQAQARQLFRPLFTQFAAPSESPVNYEKINNEEKIQQEKKSIPKRKSFDALRTSFFVENQSSAIDRNSALYDALKRQSGLENHKIFKKCQTFFG